MLRIKNLHAGIEGNEILHGVNLNVKPGEVHAIMGPNGSGKSTLASVIAGKEDYDITEGEILFKDEDISELDPEERAYKGIFLSFQYPVEIPGVTVTNFIRTAINETRKAQKLEPMPGAEMLKKIREKKRNEIFQMAMMDPTLAILDETDSGLDIDSLKIVADGVNALRNKDKSIVVITHYQRLLDYIVPDFVHVIMDGKIVKSGGKELALELDKKGYDWLKEELV